MNARIRRLGIALSACYLAVFGMLNWVQVFHAEALREEPQNVDRFRQDFARNRGTITTADGVVIAESVEVNDEFDFQRRYPTGDLFAPVTGFYSFEFGATGLEQSYYEELVGDTAEQQLRGFADLFVDEDQVGNLITTVHNDLQAKAREQLGQRRGAVVAIDPRTGAVLALWDYPSYDPNALATHDFEAARAARAFLQPDRPSSPLIATSYQDRVLPRVDLQGRRRLQRPEVRRGQPGLADVPGRRRPMTRPTANRSATPTRAAARSSRSWPSPATARSPGWRSRTSGRTA